MQFLRPYRLPQLVAGWEEGIFLFLVARLARVGGLSQWAARVAAAFAARTDSVAEELDEDVGLALKWVLYCGCVSIFHTCVIALKWLSTQVGADVCPYVSNIHIRYQVGPYVCIPPYQQLKPPKKARAISRPQQQTPVGLALKWVPYCGCASICVSVCIAKTAVCLWVLHRAISGERGAWGGGVCCATRQFGRGGGRGRGTARPCMTDGCSCSRITQCVHCHRHERCRVAAQLSDPLFPH